MWPLDIDSTLTRAPLPLNYFRVDVLAPLRCFFTLPKPLPQLSCREIGFLALMA